MNQTIFDIQTAARGIESARNGMSVISNGKTPIAHAVQLGMMRDMGAGCMEDTLSRIDNAMERIHKDHSVESLMALAEIVSAAVELETSSRMFMLGTEYTYQFTRKRHGIEMTRDEAMCACIKYDDITDEETGHRIARGYRKGNVN